MLRGLTSRMLLVNACILFAFAIRVDGADSLQEKLKVKTDFVPEASAPVDRLIKIGRRFKIPMAIEWVEAGNTEQPSEIRAGKRTVLELIQEVVSGSIDYVTEVEGGLLRIYSPTAAFHPFNFLNIELDHFEVNNADIFDAEDQLRWAIRLTLEPKKYRNGYGGGYGHGSPDVFEIPKFTINSSNLTVRQALNQIALAQGNALWVTTIKRSELDHSEPYWKKKGADDGEIPVTSRWHYFPLSELEELAKERVVVDLSIKGYDDWRVTNIPVLLEHGMAASSGGMMAGSSSAGVSYSYHASVKKVGKDFVTLSVNLTVSRDGESEFKFEEPINVSRDQVTELRPEFRITLKAYIEKVGEP